MIELDHLIIDLPLNRALTYSVYEDGGIYLQMIRSGHCKRAFLPFSPGEVSRNPSKLPNWQNSETSRANIGIVRKS